MVECVIGEGVMCDRLGRSMRFVRVGCVIDDGGV